MNHNIRLLLALLALQLFSLPGFAWPPEVAPELNFTNAEMHQAWRAQANPAFIVNPTSMDYQVRFMRAVQAKCPECKIAEDADKYGVRKFRVTTKENWTFFITLDPSVIEITATPLPIDKLPEMKSNVDDLIFGVAKELNLHPGASGHLNYGIKSTFGDDSKLFYNFITDYLNTPALTRGVMGYVDNANAPHPERLEPAQRNALKKVLDEFNPEKQTAKDLAKSLFKDVYYKSPVFGGADGEPPQKYHAVNIVSLTKDGDSWPRLELRAIQMQHSAKEIEQLSNLFAARMAYLKKNPGKIAYVGDKTYHAATSASMVEDFYRYVVESGLSWDEYRPFVTKNYSFPEGLAAFEAKLARGEVKVVVDGKLIDPCQKKFNVLGGAPAVP